MSIALAFVILVAALLAFVLWSRTRRRHVAFDVDRDADPAALSRSFAGLTWGRLVEGNAVRIVQNGDFFDVVLADVAKASHHVHLETFLWEDGHVSNRVVAALTGTARRGVEVRVLVDQRGGKTTSPAVWRTLGDGGVDLRVYHRARLRELGWYNNRDHRKIAVIDGRIGWTFGHGIADMWDDGRGWRDTAARIEGPVVAELQMAFFQNWIKVRRCAAADPSYFPPLDAAGTTPIHVAWAAPPETMSGVARLYSLAIASAREEILLANPYFLPDRHAMRLYEEALARGVAVRLMLPAAHTSDFPLVQHASHAHYGTLLRAGAAIYEHARSGIHQKVMIVDRRWCTIGSANFDPRSFRINDEISVAIHDAAVARELALAFEEDVRGAQEWTLERWNVRPFRHRLRDRLSALGKRQL